MIFAIAMVSPGSPVAAQAVPAPPALASAAKAPAAPAQPNTAQPNPAQPSPTEPSSAQPSPTQSSAPPRAATPPTRTRIPASPKILDARLAQARAESSRLAGEQRTLLTRLRQIELAIETRELEREKTTRARLVSTKAVDAAVTHVAAADAELAELMPEVRTRLTRLYRLMPLGYDRLLFSLDDARTFDRAARVVAVLARRDRERLERFAQLRASRAGDVERLRRERDTLDLLTQRLAGEEAALAETAGIQQRLLADVRERRDLNAQLVRELAAARDRLEQSMAELTADRGASSVALPGGGRLKAGTMAWPVPGRIDARFGRQASSRFGTMVNRNGIDIGTDVGSPVTAVQAGTVAYADAFAGFGRVVIVDHGGRFYTLYGHLGSVDVSKGAVVHAGDEIGTVGMAPTGTPSLYFEVRIDGRPADPVQWLKPAPSKPPA
ncbi:MAG: peptidoglycan DD-metalloendopeptidase family protein [Vicinamibacteraceae bacterium]